MPCKTTVYLTPWLWLSYYYQGIQKITSCVATSQDALSSMLYHSVTL